MQHQSQSEMDEDAFGAEPGGATGRGRIPFVQQLSAMECGAACLTMVLSFHGRRVSLDEVREVLGPGRDGVTALGIIHAATYFGLQGSGVAADSDAKSRPPNVRGCG